MTMTATRFAIGASALALILSACASTPRTIAQSGAAADQVAEGLASARDLGLEEECVVRATVQQANCVVMQVLTCEGLPEADRKLAYFDKDGLYSLSTLREGVYETAWIDYRAEGGPETVEITNIDVTTPDFDPTIPGSEWAMTGDYASSLYGTGKARGGYVVNEDEPGEDGIYEMTSTGRLSGEVAKAQGAIGDDIKAKGSAWYDPETQALIGKLYRVSSGGFPGPKIDRSAVSIARPGEPGYGSVTPTAGCGAAETS